MGKKKREVPELNSSSTADISFILLIFFLVTTSMDTDKGLARRLPPPPEDHQEMDETKVKERNVLQVRINAMDETMIQIPGKKEPTYITDLSEIRTIAKEFIDNPNNSANLPDKVAREIKLFGTVYITEKHVISLQSDRGTSYSKYFEVQNELVAAYNELRDELAREKFHKPFVECNEDENLAIREYYPLKISEAEPRNYAKR
ncbi:MAG: biopolymer transporter ExbD [Bacteroidaceae bacterium]|nr:biopolymer transporter ExbD [Bacteroidaceae bacterium]